MQLEVFMDAKSQQGAPTMVGCDLGKILKFATFRCSKSAFPEVLYTISKANVKW